MLSADDLPGEIIRKSALSFRKRLTACIIAKCNISNIRLIKTYLVSIIFHYLVKLVQHYGPCFSVLEIYAKLETLSCLLAKIEH